MDRLYFKDQKDCVNEIASSTAWKGIRLFNGDTKVCSLFD
jgi:hypothetical protein